MDPKNFKVGQLWKDRQDQLFIIIKTDRDSHNYPIVAENFVTKTRRTFTVEGKTLWEQDSPTDLTELMPEDDYPEYYI